MKGVGGTGGSGGVVGATPTGVEFGLNVGIGQLGISTDYGGGIVVAIGWQKIVWGREGGKIYYNVGGFEVLVEARDCVVVETRKIAGQIVSRHVYPDPGCKLPPEDPESESDPIQQQPSSNNPNSISTVKYCIGGRYELVMSLYLFPVEYAYRIYGIEEALDRLDAIITRDENYSKEYEDSFADRAFGANNWYTVTVFGKRNVRGQQWIWISDADSNFLGRKGVTYHQEGIICTQTYYSDIYLRKGTTIKNFGNYAFGSAGYDFKTILESAIPPPPCQPPIPRPPGGNQPPMNDSCCKSLKADIADIKKVLATKEILAGKMTFPWRWRMPGGEGAEVIADYPNLARAIAQMIDHLGIHPPKLSIKDINNAVAGDQSISNQFPCATQGFEALMAQVWDANADVDTLTNFLYRLSWLCVQQSMNLARLSGDIQSIKDMIGGKTEFTETSITTPFNIGAGIKESSTKGKGFENKGGAINQKIDANTEISTESLLPDFLKIRENPILIEKFSGDKDVYDMLTLILLKLESLQRR